MIIKTLTQLGFSEKKINVYLACLKLGPSPVRKISEEAKINRGSTYDILKQLIQDGLVSYYHKHKNQYFIAEDPKKLSQLVEDRHQQLLETKGRVYAIVPQLKSLYENAQAKPVVKFYEGHAGAKNILSHVLDICSANNNKEYYVYSSSAVRNYIYKLYPNFSYDRIKLGIRVKAIALGPGGEKRGLDERKWLGEEYSMPVYTLIYHNHVGTITLDDDEQPTGLIIKDKNIYDHHRKLFEFIWDNINNVQT